MTIAVEPIPAHRWTHDGDKVLIVKCVGKDGRTYNDFRWPKSGPVVSPNWSTEASCESGGLFGWPWGLGIGGGKEPDYTVPWVVFACPLRDDDGKPNIIALDGKCKAHRGEVVYFGDWWGAIMLIDAGRIAWIKQAARGAASATGESCTVECTSTGLCAVVARVCFWRIHLGAVLVQRWEDEKKRTREVLFRADDWELEDGQLVMVEEGEIYVEWD